MRPSRPSRFNSRWRAADGCRPGSLSFLAVVLLLASLRAGAGEGFSAKPLMPITRSYLSRQLGNEVVTQECRQDMCLGRLQRVIDRLAAPALVSHPGMPSATASTTVKGPDRVSWPFLPPQVGTPPCPRGPSAPAHRRERQPRQHPANRPWCRSYALRSHHPPAAAARARCRRCPAGDSQARNPFRGPANMAPRARKPKASGSGFEIRVTDRSGHFPALQFFGKFLGIYVDEQQYITLGPAMARNTMKYGLFGSRLCPPRYVY